MAMFIEEPKRLMITVGLPLGYILHQLSFRPQPSRGKLKGHAATTCAVSQIKTIDYHVWKTFSMAEAGRTLPRRSFGEKERKASFFFFFFPSLFTVFLKRLEYDHIEPSCGYQFLLSIKNLLDSSG